MIGCLPAAIDLEKRMRQMRSTAQARLVGRPANRVNRIVFEQQDSVGNVWIVSFLRDNFFLQRQGVGKIHSAEPAHYDRRDSPRRVLAARKRVPPEMIKFDTHICAAPGIPNRAASCARKWVSAIARASAESASGVSVNPSNARIMKAT